MKVTNVTIHFSNLSLFSRLSLNLTDSSLICSKIPSIRPSQPSHIAKACEQLAKQHQISQINLKCLQTAMILGYSSLKGVSANHKVASHLTNASTSSISLTISTFFCSKYYQIWKIIWSSIDLSHLNLILIQSTPPICLAFYLYPTACIYNFPKF